MKGRRIVYVDDIVAICRRENLPKVQLFKGELIKKYEITRPQRKLWLCQNSYIGKIASVFHLKDFRLVYTYQTRTLAIEYSSRNIKSQIVVCADDAELGDDPISRESTEGFIFALFRGAIDWRSTGCLAYLHLSRVSIELRAELRAERRAERRAEVLSRARCRALIEL